MTKFIGRKNNQVSTNAQLGGMAFQDSSNAAVGNIDIESISGSPNIKGFDKNVYDTAVDVFVYDTSKDSDGGEWRKRTSHTSWYNETLNTATRGSRREFPAVAVIVCESDTLTIYDGDDPDLPMWMVFNLLGVVGSNSNMIPRGGSSSESDITSIACLNGRLAVGLKDVSGTVGEGLTVIDFISELARIHRTTGSGYTGAIYKLSISGRNSNSLYSGDYNSLAIIAETINDVAMTVLPNAPIDSATGLPVPTIAVATDGGVSVIKDDGTVVDITGTSQGTDMPVDMISFVGNDKIMYSHRYASEINTISSSDVTAAYYNQTSTWLGRISNSISHDSTTDVSALSSDNNIESIAITETFAASKSVSGLSLANNYAIRNDVDRASCFITTDYNTGWMNGDIKGAFLSDTDTTNLSGGNKVTNGDAWSGAQSSTSSTPPTGWTGGNGAQWLTSTGGDGSYIRLVNAGSSQGGPNSYMSQAITTVPGKKYKISVTQIHHATISVFFRAGTQETYSDLVQNSWTSSSSNTPRYEQNTFTATGTTTYITLGIVSATNNYSVGWDDVVVTEVDEDRSVNANGLHSFGTITKSAVATGADLVGYSPSSNTSYLEQPYNSALDYGTGDMYYSVWVYASSSDSFSGNTYIFERSSISDTNNRRIEARMTTSTKLEIYANGGALDNNVPVPANSWYKLDILRRSGEAFVYINGEYHSSTTGGAATGSLTDTSAKLVIGNRAYFETRQYGFPSNSKIALFRTGAGAPSAAQVKKMYEDEKFLFQENAKATLYGSSDAVTALAYDEKTNLLHVGTSSGRSEFQGLRRINNTTKAVSTAISAHDGFIAQQ